MQRAGTLRAVLPRFFFRTFPVLRETRPCERYPLGSKIETRVRLFVSNVRSSITERRVRSDSRAGEGERKVKRKKEKEQEKRRSTLLRSFVLDKRARSLAGSLGRTIALRAAYDETTTTTTTAFQGKRG